ncbi:MAG: hypothetical protein R3F39_10065 [Myxococcota bacterium]
MFESWFLTAQDPIAVGLVVLGVAFSVWLRHSIPDTHGCGSCPAVQPPKRRRVSRPLAGPSA